MNKQIITDFINLLSLKLELTVDDIITLHSSCVLYVGINESLVLSALIKACTIPAYKLQVVDYVNTLVGLPVNNAAIEVLNRYGNIEYGYLYDSISQFYLTDAEVVVEPPVIITATVKEVEDFGNTEQLVVPNSLTPIVWGVQQSEALNLIYKWLRTSNRKQIFRLFGHAGCGKGVVAKQVFNFVDSEQGKQNVPKGEILFAAYTGKAASVLKKNGCLNATTLHSLVYKPVIDPTTGRCVGFNLNHESPIAQAALLIVDEVSMVNEELARDVLSFGTPVLVLGDPFQLPPIEGLGFFTEAKPDYLLTEIYRQLKDSPIIYLATRVREGKKLKPGNYGESTVYEYGNHVSDELLLSSSQIIVGLNNTRKSLNIKVRKLNGRYEKNPTFPVKGDRLICLKNNQDKTLFNGTTWKCNQPILASIMQPKYKNSKFMVAGSTNVLKFKVQSEDQIDSAGKLLTFDTQCSLHHFDSNLAEPSWRDIAGADSFDFAYAITTHKGQGSQFDSVLGFDESQSFGQYSNQWLYTLITRAITKVTIQQ